MSIERTADLDRACPAGTTLPFLVELRTGDGPLAYVRARADTRDDARALIDAQLGHADDCEDVTIVSVHPIH